MTWGERITRREAIAHGAVGLGAAATASLWLPELVRSADAQATAITNLVPNPRAVAATAGWGGFVTGTGSSSRPVAYLASDGFAPATTCAEYAVTPSLTVGTAAIYPPRTAPGSVAPGQVVWAHVAAKVASAATTPSGLQLVLRISWANSAGAVIQEDVVRTKDAPAIGAWYELEGFIAAPANAAQCYPSTWLVYTDPKKSGASTLRATDAMIVANPPTYPPYFDGSVAGCTWTGAANNSASSGPSPAVAKPARSGFLVGWNDNSVMTGPPSWVPAKDVQVNQEIGMTVLRVTCDLRSGWTVGNTTTIDWTTPNTPAAKIDQLNTLCQSAGIKLLPIPLGTPPWMRPPGSSGSTLVPPMHSPTDLYPQWADICVQLVQRWGPNLAGIEIWNEANLKQFWTAPTGASPKDYTDLLKACYPKLKAASPSVPVLVGGISDNQTTSTLAGNMSISDFLSGMYSNGAKGNYDAMAYHPYPAGIAGTATWDAAVRQVQGLMTQNGDSSPVWITEVGYSSTGDGTVTDGAKESLQQSTDLLLYSMMKRMPNVQAVCFHTSVSPTGVATNNSEAGYEFVERDTDRRKPVFTAVKAELAAERV